MGRFDGKVSIITGAGTGIGKGIARAYAKEGAALVIASRNKETLEITAREARMHGGTVLVVPTDVTDEKQVKALFQQSMDEFGRVDILVNNAGVFDGGPLEDVSLEIWEKVVSVNLTGVFLCTREAMRIMKVQGGGRIINVGSISALSPRPNWAPYTASKAAVIGLTRATALEGREFGVVASCLHPGNVMTERKEGSVEPVATEAQMTVDDVAVAAVTMAALPSHVNMLEATVVPVAQPYLGRG